MCDNTLLADQIRARLDQASQDVDIALEQVRNIKSTILAQMTAEAEAAGLYDNEPTFDQVAEAIKTIRKHNADPDRGIYLEQGEYMDLMTYKRQVERVRELHKQVTENNAACDDPDCCGEYEEWEVCADCGCDYPCPTIQILDGEIGSVEPVKLEALDGEQ